MEQNSRDEIDLIVAYNIVVKIVKRWVVLAFQALDFIIKKWKIVLTLLILGFAYGLYSSKTTSPGKNAKVLLRVNFDATSYVYNAVELLQEKFNERDTVFLAENKFRTDTPEIRALEMTPIINIKEITEGYEPNDRNLEALIKNLEFDEEIKLAETFNVEYKYHNLELTLASISNDETLQKLMDYLNDNPFLENIKEVTVSNIKNHIADNIKIMSQMDDIINAYNTNNSLSTPAKELYIVDKNFSTSGIINRKIELLEENDILKEDLAYNKDIVVLVSKPNVFSKKRGLAGKKHILYPILFVFAFLFLAWTRHTYRYLREIAAKSE